MITVDELIAWLRQQLDDDERVARQVMADPGGVFLDPETDATNVMTIAAHLYRWPPKRVLAEVEAKRRILDEAIRLSRYDGEFEFVQLLARPYAGRAGWREEWTSVRYPLTLPGEPA